MPADPLTESQRANYVQLRAMDQEGLRLDDSDAHCLLAIIDDLCSRWPWVEIDGTVQCRSCGLDKDVFDAVAGGHAPLCPFGRPDPTEENV